MQFPYTFDCCRSFCCMYAWVFFYPHFYRFVARLLKKHLAIFFLKKCPAKSCPEHVQKLLRSTPLHRTIWTGTSWYFRPPWVIFPVSYFWWHFDGNFLDYLPLTSYLELSMNAILVLFHSDPSKIVDLFSPSPRTLHKSPLQIQLNTLSDFFCWDYKSLIYCVFVFFYKGWKKENILVFCKKNPCFLGDKFDFTFHSGFWLIFFFLVKMRRFLHFFFSLFRENVIEKFF